MYCPRCGEERVSEATNFCSRCGFLLKVTSELIPTGGMLPAALMTAPSGSPQSRGVKHGFFLFLLAIVLFPILGMIAVFAIGLSPWPAGLMLFVLGGFGLLRIAYALMFESKDLPADDGQLNRGMARSSLPGYSGDSDFNPPSFGPEHLVSFGHWRDTNDLERASVTETTTKPLEKESEPRS